VARQAAPTPVPFWLAAATAAGLSALFMVVYNATNFISAQRTDVGTWFFPWELAIPFVPLMIIPYMSIDLFFVAAPWVARDRRELNTLTWRITLAILVAGFCFLAFPLKLGFERHPVDGVLGLIFNPFLAVDKPYNLLPSLHIALRTILADLYARHTLGLTRLASNVWFSLIGVSTLFTHQHHLVDLAGGFLLALACFYLVADAPLRLPVVKNPRIGVYYAIGAVLAIAFSLLFWPWSAALLWPAVALGIVAPSYWGLGPGIFRKTVGRLPLATRIVLGPVLLGQQISLLYYRRQCRAWDEAAPGVWIGRTLTDTEAAAAIGQGVTGVLDLTAEFSEAAPFLAANYRHLPILDLTAPTQDQLREAVGFITEQSSSGTVYVHCKIGYSRSAAVIGAYLLASGQTATADDAVARLRSVRPTIVIRREALEALRAFEKSAIGGQP
jgi:protein-tyrosine phosphatase